MVSDVIPQMEVPVTFSEVAEHGLTVMMVMTVSDQANRLLLKTAGHFITVIHQPFPVWEMVTDLRREVMLMMKHHSFQVPYQQIQSSFVSQFTTKPMVSIPIIIWLEISGTTILLTEMQSTTTW